MYLKPVSAVCAGLFSCRFRGSIHNSHGLIVLHELHDVINTGFNKACITCIGFFRPRAAQAASLEELKNEIERRQEDVAEQKAEEEELRLSHNPCTLYRNRSNHAIERVVVIGGHRSSISSLKQEVKLGFTLRNPDKSLLKTIGDLI